MLFLCVPRGPLLSLGHLRAGALVIFTDAPCVGEDIHPSARVVVLWVCRPFWGCILYVVVCLLFSISRFMSSFPLLLLQSLQSSALSGVYFRTAALMCCSAYPCSQQLPVHAALMAVLQSGKTEPYPLGIPREAFILHTPSTVSVSALREVSHYECFPPGRSMTCVEEERYPMNFHALFAGISLWFYVGLVSYFTTCLLASQNGIVADPSPTWLLCGGWGPGASYSPIFLSQHS